MSDALLPYYDRELNAIRRLAAEFATPHPKRPGRLRLAPDALAGRDRKCPPFERAAHGASQPACGRCRRNAPDRAQMQFGRSEFWWPRGRASALLPAWRRQCGDAAL